MISILLASSSCQKDYLHEALDEADRERCQQVPGLVDRVDWRSSRFLKQQAMTALAAGARHSLSHSQGHAMLATSHTVAALGVDMERMKPRAFEALLPAFARPEEIRWWQQQPDGCAAFYMLWTLKEALFKAQDRHGSVHGIQTLGVCESQAGSVRPRWRLQGPDPRPWHAISAVLAPSWVLACCWVQISADPAAMPIHWQRYGLWSSPLRTQRWVSPAVEIPVRY